MRLGTKTLLFGVHGFFIHPILVLIAWVKIYHEFPSWRELVCIIIHDWGYWGKTTLKDKDGDNHPEFGANLAGKWFGKEWHDFVLGHSNFYIIRHGVSRSKLLAPDKYWHCIIPIWFYKIISVPSGEWNHYRSVTNARQVGPLTDSDEMWWKKIQDRCREKVNGTFTIDYGKLEK